MSSRTVFIMKVAVLFVLLLLWGQAAGAQTVITIDVNKSGDALWTMEKRVPLTKPEINEWETAIKAGQSISRYKDAAEFNDTVNLFVHTSHNFSTRSMEIEEFNISNVSYDIIKTVSDGFGVISYSFWWKNFSFINSSKIYIGDAFSEGMVLSPDNVLIINIPDGYKVQDVSPNFDKHDGNSLVWTGTLYRNFSKGEPSIVLTRAVMSNNTMNSNYTLLATDNNMWPVIVVPVVILMACALFVYMIWKKRRLPQIDSAGTSTAQVDKNTAQVDNIGNNTAQIDNTGNNTAQIDNLKSEATLPQDIPIEFLGDEDMIEHHLLNSGGQAYQSDIVKKSGLSKSKISIVLAKMKEDGRILKIRKGKENIIRLVTKK